MKKHEQVETEAKTVAEAIKKALKILGASRDSVDIKILAEGERGLFNMEGAKPARIRATLKDKRRNKQD
ncbi:MAG: Jag N-terminal domain-containing protein [Candidatus Omnitrophota bacterium]